MKKRQLILLLAVVLAAGGWWLARSARHDQALENSSTSEGLQTPEEPNVGMGAGDEAPPGPPKPGRMLRPPNPAQRFLDFTPEQRVEFARRGHGPGG